MMKYWGVRKHMWLSFFTGVRELETEQFRYRYIQFFCDRLSHGDRGVDLTLLNKIDVVVLHV
jgi:hypothetical protein